MTLHLFAAETFLLTDLTARSVFSYRFDLLILITIYTKLLKIEITMRLPAPPSATASLKTLGPLARWEMGR